MEGSHRLLARRRLWSSHRAIAPLRIGPSPSHWQTNEEATLPHAAIYQIPPWHLTSPRHQSFLKIGPNNTPHWRWVNHWIQWGIWYTEPQQAYLTQGYVTNFILTISLNTSSPRLVRKQRGFHNSPKVQMICGVSCALYKDSEDATSSWAGTEAKPLEGMWVVLGYLLKRWAPSSI